MKLFRRLLALATLFAFATGARADVANPGNSPGNNPVEVSPYTVIERGPHHRVWQQVTVSTNLDGVVDYRTNAYKELQTGMHHLVSGQWIESNDQIQITANGGIASNSQHSVTFSAQINTLAAIDLLTPDGFHLQSHVMGLGFADPVSGKGVLIASLQDSIGQLLPSLNQVVYTNAFTNLQADVRYSQKLNGFEQDIILRQQLPDPSQFGLEPASTKLQIWTEFIQAPTPQQTSGTNQHSGLVDEELDFGIMKMSRGNAFSIGDENVLVPVAKHWSVIQGRTFLIEEVLLSSLATQLQSLPPPSSNGSSPGSLPSGNGGHSSLSKPQTYLASGLGRVFDIDHPALLSPKAATKSAGPLRQAGISPSQRGLVLDYNIVNGSLTNFVFQSDTTFFLTNEVDLYGSCVLEGGTVIKFSTNTTASIVIAYTTNLVCQTGPCRSAIFTAQDDDTVGSAISGSSGSPSGYYGGAALKTTHGGTGSWKGLRFSFFRQGMNLQDGNYTVYDAQFVNCQWGVYLDTVSFYLRNALFYNVSTNFYCVPDPCSLDLQNVTVHNTNSGRLCNIVGYEADPWDNVSGDGPEFTFSATNCLFVGIATPGVGIDGDPHSWYFYSYWAGAFTSVFQTVGAGAHYLTNGSPYRGVGTTNIDPVLLAGLQQKTTYPPIILSNILVSINTALSPQAARGNSTAVDLGYEYDPIDFLVDLYTVTNAMLTLTNGVALACFNDSAGIWLQDNSSLVSFGSPLAPNWLTRYSSVQEMPVAIGSVSPGSVYTINSYHYGSVGPSGVFRFSKFSCPAGGGSHLVAPTSWAYSNLLVQDSEFYVGQNDFSGDGGSDVTVIRNNLFDRSPVTAVNSSSSPSFGFTNNLVWGASVNFSAPSGGAWYAFDNTFDTCAIGRVNSISNGYNAYLNTTRRLTPTNVNDYVSGSSLAWQTGPLGAFYQPTNSPLLNLGNTSATNVGLYHFTVQTNQGIEGTNIVSLGYHYVALDTNSLPNDTFNTGIPDYLADPSGALSIALAAWEWKYFGNLGVSLSADYDGDGVSNLDEYLNGTDPNKIQFSISVTNQFSATNQLPAQLSVSRGVPSNAAVLIDSTNFTSATWTAFNSNLLVNLGTNEGWHDIWVGLRGLSASSVQTWSWRRAKFDKTPPLLVITNPITSTVIRPTIQLQGFSPEPLAGLYFDVTNAAGSVSNQQGFVSGQVFDTNTFTYNTNWFQCFDIDLTNGVNSITMRATDLAGNLMVTNFSYTLNYSAATNPPVITLNWPQNNTQIAGTNFALRGVLNDPTAIVSAQLVDTNGVTNLVFGLVERSGLFWMENIPLNGGANQLTLTATDAAGNVSTTNINVIQSPLGLTVDDFSGANLYGLAMTVSGTLSDNSYTVWVNGVVGTNNGDGTWTALNVPVNRGGTAIVQARAIPNIDNGGNGTPSSFDMNNPVSPDAVDVNPEIDKPTRVYLAKYTSSWSSVVNNYVVPRDEPQSDTYSEQWADGSGGNYTEVQHYAPSTNGFNVDNLSYVWPADTWPTSVPATFDFYWDSHVDEETGTNLAFNVDWEHTEDQATIPFFDDIGSTVTYALNTESSISLFTGGKSSAHSESIFAVSVAAQQRFTTWQWWPGYTNGPAIDPASITMALGVLGADGVVWKALPNGQTVDVTPKTSASRYNSSVSSIKYMPKMMFNGMDVTGTRMGDDYHPIKAGALYTLNIQFVPTLPSNVKTIYEWESDDEILTDWVAELTNSYKVPVTQFTNSSLMFGWYKEGWKTIKCDVEVKDPANATPIIIQTTAEATRPKTTLSFTQVPSVAVDNNYDTSYIPALHFGDYLGVPVEITFSSVPDTTLFQFLQIATVYRVITNAAPPPQYDYEQGTGVDAQFPYGGPRHFNSMWDAPGMGPLLTSDISGVYASDSFTTYLMYHPSGSGSFYVPLRKIEWSWHGQAVPDTNSPVGWRLVSGSAGSSASSSDSDAPDYPTWTNSTSIIVNTKYHSP